MSQEKLAEVTKETGFALEHVKDKELIMWLTKESSLPYIMLAKQIEESGLTPEALKPLIDSINNSKRINSK